MNAMFLDCGLPGWFLLFTAAVLGLIGIALLLAVLTVVADSWDSIKKMFGRG
jgi:hypothetical protein